MILTRTPFRISFVGGGSDLEEFYKHSPGAVLSTTINKYMYIASHNFFDEKQIRMKYKQTETVKNPNEFKHPIVREVIKKFKIKGALEISSHGDVPSGSGLGSSSSFTVGLLHNLYIKTGIFITKEQLAEDACDIEINKLNDPIGKQDQYAAAFGGLNIFKFNPSGKVNVETIHLKKEIYKTLESRLLMFYIGKTRKASTILSEQKKNMLSKDRREILKRMVSLVWEMLNSIYNNDLDCFGKILHKNWILKQKLASKVSNPEINTLYNKALCNGAIGGKVLGAGGGGFFLFYSKEQEKLRKAMCPLRELKFKFDNEGSKLIYVGDEYNEH